MGSPTTSTARTWRGNATVLLCTATVILVWCGVYLPFSQPPESRIVMVIIFGCAAVQMVAFAAWYNQHNYAWFSKLFHERPAKKSQRTAADENPFESRAWEDLSPEFRRRLVVELASPYEQRRRHSVQVLSSLPNSPIGRLDCWPVKTCTDLQLAAAEAVLRDWAEYVDGPCALTEDQLIHLMFPEEYELRIERPRVRRIA
ncbi:MAG: hypothetical protein ACJ8F7_22740, partial [Gemmataceae bacterium]